MAAKMKEPKSKLWLQVQEITNQARQQVIQVVRQLCSEIDQQKGALLRQLCNEYAARMWLTIDASSGNPFLIRPMLYVYFDGADSPAKKTSWHKLSGKLAHWASSQRVTLKMIDQPYNQDAEYKYP